MKPPFTQEEWEKTPESIRVFVMSLIRQVENGRSPASPILPSTPVAAGDNGAKSIEVKKENAVKTNNKLVVFISDVPRSREAKLMRGLREQGWTGILLHRDKPTFDPSKDFSQFYSYRTPEQALNLARNFSPLVYHLFSNWNFDTAEHVIRNKPGPVVFDDYDVMGGMVQEEVARSRHPGQLEKERYCLEKADGLACRSLELQYAKNRLGYEFGGKRIFIPDGCYGDIPKPIDLGAKLKIAYCGNLSTNGKDNYLAKIADRVQELGLELHIYPSIQTKVVELRSRMRAIDPTGTQVVVHDTLPHDLLLRELAGYHYGLHALTPEDDGILQTYRIEKFMYASANKVFDYIDAGLYSFVHHGKFMRFLMGRFGLGMYVDDPLKMISQQGVPERIRVPQSLLVRSIAKRLAAFYERTEQEWQRGAQREVRKYA